jgi:hypothetical protein
MTLNTFHLAGGGGVNVTLGYVTYTWVWTRMLYLPSPRCLLIVHLSVSRVSEKSS